MSESATNSRSFSDNVGVALTRVEDFAPPAGVLLDYICDARASRPKISELARILRHDSQLAAVALEGCMGEDVEPAIKQLGFETVRNRVLAVQLPAYFSKPLPKNGEPGFDWAAFWQHCRSVAALAQSLAAAHPACRVMPETAYLAGLVHDLGKVALAHVYPRGFLRTVAYARQNRCDLQTAESAVLGTTHTQAGRRLAECWGMPAPLRETIWLHHYSQPGAIASATARELVRIVQAANQLAHLHAFGDSGNAQRPAQLSDLAREVNISPGDLEAAVIALENFQKRSDAAKKVSRVSVSAASNSEHDLVALESQNEKLKTVARYFTAMEKLDLALSGQSSTRDVLRASLSAIRDLWAATPLGAFAASEVGQSITLARVDERHGLEFQEYAIKEQLRATLGDHGSGASEHFESTPREVRLLLGPFELAEHESAWFTRIMRGENLVGGIVVRGDARFAQEMEVERAECRVFFNRVGLSLCRAETHANTQRLADELADSNRRLQANQSEMLRSRSLAMIAELAAGAGHELNNPLSVISGRAQLLLRDVPQDSESYRSLEQILAKSHECSRIVSDLMDFARPRAPVFEAIRIDDLLGAIEELWQSRQRPNIRLERSGNPSWQTRESPTLRGDRQQLIQVFEELINNAVDSFESRGGHIRIGVRTASQPQAAGMAEPFSRGVEFTVADDGAGMSPSVLQRAFDPFFSHRPAGRRRGLGLTRVHRILDAHGGRIWMESRVGEGTQVHVFIPVTP